LSFPESACHSLGEGVLKRRSRRIDWTALKDEVETALRGDTTFPSSVRIDGKITRLGDGLNHDNYVFQLDTDEPLPLPKETLYVLRKCKSEDGVAAYAEAVHRLQREAAVLRILANQGMDVAIPEFICFVRDDAAQPTGFIETALRGICLGEIKKLPEKASFMIESIGRVAAAVHHLPVDRFDLLSGCSDSREHMVAWRDSIDLDVLDSDPVAIRAIEWINDHLSTDRSLVVLHGDLLPQNLLWMWEHNRLGVIDWEYARIGDPAYDLAIVTRGNARLCGLNNGLKRLLAAYHEAGGIDIVQADVVVHELFLVLSWLADSLQKERQGNREGDSPKQHRDKLRMILRRVESL